MCGSQSLRSEITTETETTFPKSDEALEDAKERIKAAEMVVLTDGDADGMASASLINHVYHTLHVEVFPVGPHRPMLWEGQALDLIRKYGRDDLTVYFLDTCLNGSPEWVVEKLSYLPESVSVRFFDHHKWPDEDRVEYVSEHTDVFEIDSHTHSNEWTIRGHTVEDRCTTQMVYDYFVRNGVQFGEELRERVEAIAAGDLWLRTETDIFIHPDTEMMMDSVDYITDKSPISRAEDSWYGYREWAEAFTDTTTPCDNTIIQTYAQEYRKYVDNLVEFLYQNSEQFMTVKESSGLKLASIYGDVPPNDIAERLRQEGFDAVAILRPNLSVSFRGSDKFTVCDTIASELDGGGHEQASGAKLYNISEQEIESEEYRQSYGQTARTQVLDLMENHI